MEKTENGFKLIVLKDNQEQVVLFFETLRLSVVGDMISLLGQKFIKMAMEKIGDDEPSDEQAVGIVTNDKHWSVFFYTESNLLANQEAEGKRIGEEILKAVNRFHECSKEEAPKESKTDGMFHTHIKGGK